MRWALPVVLLVAGALFWARRRPVPKPAPPDLGAVAAEVARELERQYDLFEPDALRARLDRVRLLVEREIGTPVAPVGIVAVSADAWTAREIRRTGPADPALARVDLWDDARGRFAEYWPDENLIALLPDNLLTVLPARVLGPRLDALLAHEVVRADQHKRYGLDHFLDGVDGATRLVRLAVLDGRAAHLSAPVAARLGSPFDRGQLLAALAATFMEPPSTVLEAEIDLRWAAGARFFAEVAGRLGPDAATRSVFERPPASVHQILRPRDYLAGAGAGDEVRRVIRAALDHHDGDPPRVHPVLGPALGLQVGGAEPAGFRDALRVRIKAAHGALRGRKVDVVACRFDTPADAREFCRSAVRHAPLGGRTMIGGFERDLVADVRAAQTVDGFRVRLRSGPGFRNRTLEFEVVAVRSAGIVVQLSAWEPTDRDLFLPRLAHRLLTAPVAPDPRSADAEARLAALRAGRLPAWVLDDPDPEVRAAIVEATDVMDLLHTALRHSDPVVRIRAAARVEAQKPLAEAQDDPDPRVRAAVVRRRGSDIPGALVARLRRDPSAEVRRAVASVADPERDDWIECLVTLADDLDASVRREAWARLAKVDVVDPEVVRAGFRDPDPHVRAGAVGMLGGPTRDSHPDATEMLMKALDDPSPVVRLQALGGASSLDFETKRPPPRLVQACEAPARRHFLPWIVRGATGPEADVALLRLLGDPHLRESSLLCLEGRDPGRFVIVLRALLRDRDASVRADAALALRSLTRSVDDLGAILESAWREGGLFSDRYLDELVTLRGAHALPLVHEALEHGNRLARSTACRALAGIPPVDDDRIRLIAACLQDPSEFVRSNAAEALGSLGARAHVVLDELVRALARETDEDVVVHLQGVFDSLGTAARHALPALRELAELETDAGLRAAEAIATIEMARD